MVNFDGGTVVVKIIVCSKMQLKQKIFTIVFISTHLEYCTLFSKAKHIEKCTISSTTLQKVKKIEHWVVQKKYHRLHLS